MPGATHARTVWLWVFVASLGATAVLGMMALLLPRMMFEQEMLATSALLTGYSLLGLMGSVAIARGVLAPLTWCALGLLGISLGLWLVLVWADGLLHYRTEGRLVRWGGTLTVAGVLGVHAALLLLATLRWTVSLATRTGTIASACAAGLLLIGLMWEVFGVGASEWAARLAGALALPGALGTIAVPVLARIELVSRRENPDGGFDRAVLVWVRCPRCRLEQEIGANRKSRCSSCGLAVSVTVSEPRCECGYLLHGLPEPVCPECGRDLPREAWWAPPPTAAAPTDAAGPGPVDH